MSNVQTGWASFWQEEPAADAGATLANLPPELRDRLDAPWTAFAKALPVDAKVLDLATGGGFVLDLLRRKRPDLVLTGVDVAPKLPTRPGMILRCGVWLDSLPFADAGFDGITSRFGIEYGHLAAGASEAARMLKPGGVLCFVIHHVGSTVLLHNRARRDALRWAARDSGWVSKAAKLARTRKDLALPVPPAFRGAASEAALRFPGQSAAWEFLTGLAQVLELVPRADGEAAVHQLSVRAEDELARLDALIAAACDADRLAELTDALAHGGIQLAQVRTVDEPNGAPIAWHVEGRKAG